MDSSGSGSLGSVANFTGHSVTAQVIVRREILCSQARPLGSFIDNVAVMFTFGRSISTVAKFSSIFYWLCCCRRRRWRNVYPDVMLDFERAIADQGAKVDYSPFYIRITQGPHRMLFDYESFYLVKWETSRTLAGFMRRLEFAARRDGLICDCRRPRRYRISDGRRIMLQQIPEAVDFVSGYFLQGKPRPGALVFDVGAYCGEMTAELSAAVGPGGRVIAFEPAEGNRKWLSRNVRELGLKNVTIVNAGLWKCGAATMSANFGPDASIGLAQAAGPAVDVMTLEDACGRFGVPSFVKMDIEGAEIEVIESALSFLKERDLRFAIASYHIREGKPTAGVLEEMFTSIGYNARSGYPEHLTTWAEPC